MNSPHSFRLRAYHNPKNVDESSMPAGWRFRYNDELTQSAQTPCHAWITGFGFDYTYQYAGTGKSLTYIVPVAS
jgi:hypothetical protein